MGVSSAMSQVLCSSFQTCPLCSRCLLEERDRVSACPEAGVSGVPLSQFYLSLGSTFFPSAFAPSSPEPSQEQGWCWVANPLIGGPE